MEEVITKPQNAIHMKLEGQWELDLNSFDSMDKLLDYADKIKKNFFNPKSSKRKMPGVG